MSAGPSDSAVSPSSASSPSRRTDDPFLDATAQADLVRRGEVSPAELTEAAIARIEEVDPALNAVIIPLFDKGRAEATSAPGGPFTGVPYLLKDLTVVSKGDLHAAGIAGVKAAGYRADHDSYFVQRMRAAGFTLVGKTNTPEQGSRLTTEPLAWGPTRNPWDPERSTGGSSGGAAAAVAAGLVPIAHGNDGGGSIRNPASQCGVVGLKPTRGRVSEGPTFAEAWVGAEVEMCLTRSVRDAAAVLDVVSGRHPGDVHTCPPPRRPFAREVGADPGRLRIGVLTTDPAGHVPVDPECAAAALATARVLTDLGHDVDDAHPAGLGDPAIVEGFSVCFSALGAADLDHYSRLIGRELTEEDVEPRTWDIVRYGRSITATQYLAALEHTRGIMRELEQWWEDDGHDLLLTPTLPRTSPLLGELDTDPELEPQLTTFITAFNLSGQPAISLPLAQSSTGLPIGVQLVAAYGREDLLIRVASQLERAMPWADRRPPVRAA